MTVLPIQTLQDFFDSPAAQAAQFNLSASAMEPLTQDELFELEPCAADGLRGIRLDYPQRYGAPALRERIATRYTGIEADGIVVTSGLDDALANLSLAFIEPGDKVVVLTPCYPPQMQLPRWRGADIIEWPAREENGWVPDLDELRELVDESVKLVIVTFPQNPTGFMPDGDYARALSAVLERYATPLIADEIYSGLPVGGDLSGANLASLYPHAISLHGLSKTFALPGLRVGWMASRDQAALASARKVRDLMNAYLPAPIDYMACVALDHGVAIHQRNDAIRSAAVSAATDFFARHDNLFQWQAPSAGVLTFPRYLGPGGTRALSERLVTESALTLVPSTCFGAGDNHVRVGLGRRSIAAALARLDEFLATAL